MARERAPRAKQQKQAKQKQQKQAEQQRSKRGKGSLPGGTGTGTGTGAGAGTDAAGGPEDGAVGRGRSRRRGDRESVVADVGGGRAELVPDPDRPRAWTLLIDGAPQSHVDLDDPEHLGFEYQRRIGHAIDLLAPPGRPLRVLHLGGGAFTLARYVAATRPRSTQQIAERDEALVRLVRAELPLASGVRVRVRSMDAREALGAVPDGWADLVIADVFSGARTPAHLTSVEYVAEVRRVLTPGGWYTANIADGPPLTYLRGQIATVRDVFPETALIAEPGVLRGRRFGNAVLIAAALPLPVPELGRRAATDPQGARIEHGTALRDFTAGALPVRDATARDSPRPPVNAFPG
ncbi:spermidine synthase [Streptomyces uncialis]|uniref:spermidine synthase n=1 Tax=Streptomyces uncialis TaxID=1048205 RepID=UPI000AE7DAF0|nr:fused MFS/spermidine synthase [Streptomyces uncialis]